MSVPAGFVGVETRGAQAWVREEAEAWAREVLGRGDRLHAWAATRPGARPLEGRGRVWDVPAPASGPDGRRRWAVRHYRRGGAVASLLDDRYLAAGAPRPLRELRASEAARARGVPTPAVVAGAVYPAGPFYRADLVTELVPDGVELRALLFDAAPGPDPARALEATGRLIRLLEARGVRHPDLNAANVLLTGGEAVEAWLLDLDRCGVGPEGRAAPAGPMRRRLRRSLEKLARRGGGGGLPGELDEALARGLGEAP